ncbi:MAG: ATP-dependent helicase [Aeriscardovia sp.]|nr:ATP-dependent helicase [Aeriscardovia sp.]
MPDNLKKREFHSTEDQKAVIESAAKHLLVKAGAGSGKTSTLVLRIRHFIDEGAKPQSVLGLTFTKKASMELEKRAAKELKNNSESQASVKVHTYDSFIQAIVRQYGLIIGVDPQLSPLSDAGINQCIAEVLESNHEAISTCFEDIEEIDSDFSAPYIYPLPSSFSSTDLQSSVKQFTSQALNFLISENRLSFKAAADEANNWVQVWSEYLKDLEEKLEQKQEEKAELIKSIKQLRCNARLRKLVIDLSIKYAEAREKNNLAEYGDFTLYALKLIHDKPWIAEEYRKKFKYVFLDEYQDTNHTQGILLQLLFKDGPSVTAVGDAQQAIYGFRGTAPGAFEYFKKAFKDVEVLELRKTFRNKENVASLANNITKRMPERLPLSPSEAGGNVCAMIYAGKDSEAGPRAALEFIKRQQRKNPDATIAILGRRNSDLPEYQEILSKNGIACILTGKSKFDDENPIARDLREILTVAVDPFASKEAEDLLLSPRYAFSLQDMYKVAHKAGAENKDANPDDKKEHPDPVITLPIYLRSLSEKRIEDLALSEEDGEADRRSGSEILSRFVRDIKSVEAASFVGLEHAAIEAWKVLNLNADISLADELLGSLPYEKLTLEDVLEAVKAYKSDLASNQTPSIQGFLGWIKDYQKDFRPTPMEKAGGKQGCLPVELMTIHQAKGLEWDAVVVVGMQDNLEKQDREKDSHLEDLQEKGTIPKAGKDGKESMWIDSYGSIPANLRTDLEDCDPCYRKACESFTCLSGVGIKELSNLVGDLYREEVKKTILEEAHAAYVAMTRTRGDLLLISKCPYNLVNSKGEIANVTNHGGLFWKDAVKFLLGSEAYFDDQVKKAKKDNVAFFSTNEDLKELLREAANQNASDDEEELADTWPVQIKEGIREKLQESAQRVKDAPKEGNGTGKLYKRAKALLAYEKARSQRHQNLVEHLNLVSTTDLQKLSINGGSLKDFIRPMPSRPSAAAEAGTEFHAWVAAYLLNPSEAEKVKISEKYEKISRWQSTFKGSDWSKRKCWGTEVPYSISLDRGNLGKIVVTTKLDAIFKGDLQGNREDEAFTIVDWKTGQVPAEEELPKKLLQLDIYRLALSRALHKDIKAIDACLYYVRNGGRQFSAKDKSEEEILDEILNIDEGKLRIPEDN